MVCGDLSTVDGQLSAVEESLADLVKLREGAGGDQESLKWELCVVQLQELDVRTGPVRGGALRVSAPPFMPSSSMNEQLPTQNNSGQHRLLVSWHGMPIGLSLSYWLRSTGGAMQRRLLIWPLT